MTTELIEYNDQGVKLEGFLAYNPTKGRKLPGVILCHAWRGRDDFVCEKAVEIAEWGYSVFALDMYGKGVLGNTKEENSALMSPFMQDRKFLQQRLKAALKAFQQHPSVDSKNIAAMGFCFGGLCALDFARGGNDIKGAISVHGLLSQPEGLDSKNIKAKILVLHGFDDPMVLPEEMLRFEKEMSEGKVDWQLHAYGNTMHAFTNPSANDPSFGAVYNPLAAKRAWQSIGNFLGECLQGM